MGQGFIRILHPGGSANERMNGARIDVTGVTDTGDELPITLNDVPDCIHGMLMFSPSFQPVHWEVEDTTLTPTQKVAALKALYDANPVTDVTFTDNLDGTFKFVSQNPDALAIGVQLWGRHKTQPILANITVGGTIYPLARLVESAPFTVANTFHQVRINEGVMMAVSTTSGMSAADLAERFGGSVTPAPLGTLTGILLAPVTFYLTAGGSTDFNVELIDSIARFDMTVTITTADLVKTRLCEYQDGSGAYSELGAAQSSRTYLKMRHDSGPVVRYNFGLPADADDGDVLAVSSYVEFLPLPAPIPAPPQWSKALNVYAATAVELSVLVS